MRLVGPRAGFAGDLLEKGEGVSGRVGLPGAGVVSFAAHRVGGGGAYGTTKTICEPCARGDHHGCVTGKRPLEPAWCQCTINPDTGEDEEGL